MIFILFQTWRQKPTSADIHCIFFRRIPKWNTETWYFCFFPVFYRKQNYLGNWRFGEMALHVTIRVTSRRLSAQHRAQTRRGTRMTRVSLGNLLSLSALQIITCETTLLLGFNPSGQNTIGPTLAWLKWAHYFEECKSRNRHNIGLKKVGLPSRNVVHLQKIILRSAFVLFTLHVKPIITTDAAYTSRIIAPVAC